MEFERHIFVSSTEAREYLDLLLRKTNPKKLIKIPWRVENDHDFRRRFGDRLKELASYYEDIYVDYPEFRSRDPLGIERDIVYLRLILSCIGKERFFELYRAIRTSEKAAMRTYDRRLYYWKKINGLLETNGD